MTQDELAASATATPEPPGPPRLSPAVKAASDASMAAQKRMLAASRLELALVFLAATGGAVSSVWRDGALFSVVGFLGAVMASGFIARTRPEREWYDGRAAAESCKTLAWRYAVGGRPYDLPDSDPEHTDAMFASGIREILESLPYTSVEEGAGAQITDEMRAVRAATLDRRRSVYELGRIADQQDWYARKARHNEERATTWKRAVLLLEVAGLLASVFVIAFRVEVDFIGVIAPAIAICTAWLQLKQHESLARAYSVASGELSTIRSLIAHQATDETWADFVDQSEEAISREHTLWRASRGVAVPTGLAAARRGSRR